MDEKAILTQTFHIRGNGGGSNVEPCGGATIVLEKCKIAAEEFVVGDKIALNIGVAFCHPDDNYDKKVGRIVSILRMEQTEFTIKWVDSFKTSNQLENGRYLEIESNCYILFVHLKANGNINIFGIDRK